MAKRPLITGEPAPWFIARCTSNERFAFDTVAGRYVVLCFFRSASNPLSQEVLNQFLTQKHEFNDDDATFFGVSTDPDDERLARVLQVLPGFRFFWDFGSEISRLYAACPEDWSGESYQCRSVVLDERLRIFAVIPMADSSESHVQAVMQTLSLLPQLPPEQSVAAIAPALVVPRIFEPELCRALIQFYDQHGGEESGFMRDVNGATTLIMDSSFKRRRDQEITDEKLRNFAMFRVHDRLAPEIRKAFQFNVTRIERHIVACYDAKSGGYFHPHRDNTTQGTAHRRFAVSLNLNTGEYDGGKLRFPEFGRQTYEAPAGGAVVFSCSLLHEATPVTKGRRYAYLPFLYDDEAAKIREQNLKYLASTSSGQHSS